MRERLVEELDGVVRTALVNSGFRGELWRHAWPIAQAVVDHLRESEPTVDQVMAWVDEHGGFIRHNDHALIGTHLVGPESVMEALLRLRRRDMGLASGSSGGVRAETE